MLSSLIHFSFSDSQMHLLFVSASEKRTASIGGMPTGFSMMAIKGPPANNDTHTFCLGLSLIWIWINGGPHQMLSWGTSLVNSQGQINQSGSYYYSSIMVASFDEIKNSRRKITMTLIQTMSKPHRPSHWKTRGVFYWGWNSGPIVRKISYRTQTLSKTKITSMKK